MYKFSSLAGGLAGAAALTLVHEFARKNIDDAPRMDKMAMQATSKLIRKVGAEPPSGEKLFYTAMAGDLISNSMYFSKVGDEGKKNIWVNGVLLGLTAGLSAVYLPGKLGLKGEYSSHSTKTKVMTVSLYVIGGLVAAATTSFLRKKKTRVQKVKNKVKNL